MLNKLLVCFAVSIASMCFLAQAQAQSVLPIGSVQTNGNPTLCPTGGGWDTLDGMTCQNAQIVQNAQTGGCANIQQGAPFTFGYETNPHKPYIGTVVLFNGWSGTRPTETTTDLTFAQNYYGQGFEVVMIAWAWDWELTYNPIPQGQYGNIQAAACKPATFLNYVFISPYLYNNNGTAGLAVQGHSAGSAAIAYALAWYGAGAWLDNVELTAGPEFASVEQGCQVPPAANVPICPTGQTGCVGWPTQFVISLSPEFSDGNEKGPREWTNIPACANTNGTNTSQWNQTWNNMSIVVSPPAQQQFSYPDTSMAGWLCESTTGGTMNNSTPQGQLFYLQINNIHQNYTVNAIYSCPSAEGVYDQGAVTANGTSGLSAIEADMLTNNVHKPRH